MSNSDLAPLRTALIAEYEALAAFVGLLEREQKMLVNNDSAPLLELSKQKSSDAIHLNKLTQIRNSQLHGMTPTTSTESIHAFLVNRSKECLEIWEKMLVLAKRSQQLNQTNGELIQMRLRHNQQSLAILGNAANKTNLYGSDGQPNLSLGSGKSLGRS